MATETTVPPRMEAWDDESLLKEIESLDLPETDGDNLESDWHRLEMNLLIDSVHSHMGDRTDYYVGGNMFLHFSEEHIRNKDFRGPDFFFVKNRPLHPARRYWAVWKEGGRYPNTIIELLSPRTEKADRTTKFSVYEQTFRTPEYFLYDPFADTLDGYRLGPSDRYQPIEPNEHGRMWSEELGLWVGTWRGVHGHHDMIWLRFFHPDGSLVLTAAEKERLRAEAAEAEVERLRKLLPQPKSPPA
jgi:Uma2 family endonuclease